VEGERAGRVEEAPRLRYSRAIPVEESMKFGLFYEIPVAHPRNRESELIAYQNTLEQAIAGDRLGFDAFWSVEHHFLDGYSHCSNPEVLYGAVAARTENIRIGYGVRLTPKPYNHPVRSAESAAVLDLISNGRVDFGTGRSSTRIELEGFGIHPSDTRGMWQEAVEHIVGCWTNEEYEFEGEHWSMPKRRVIPKPIQDPHPPVFGATGSDSGHQLMGELGLGLCSFGVGLPPSDIARRIDLYRKALAGCTKPLGAFVNDQVAAFTMVNCAPTKAASYAASHDSFVWYTKTAAELVASVANWLEEMDTELGTYDYLREAQKAVNEGLTDLVNFDYLKDSQAVIVGDPDQVIETCRAYQAAGVDLLLCLMNPYSISHEDVMQTIELMAKYVLPEFR
jgi:alkanesulfonate monooxygenase SsuD/methylene tetrahydromethanopterin reductase-like flavin-dependent oxidoreductase (luciferase family)